MKESGCTRPVSVRNARIESLPFSSIPAQSKLFLDYLADPEALRDLYPSAVRGPTDLAGRVDAVLAAHVTDRDVLGDALAAQNRSFGSTDATFANIEKLRGRSSVAVLTGQQTGLFTGPLYSIYKALAAIRAAESLCSQGVDAVPVFWMATEDHDLDEIAGAFCIDASGKLAETRFEAEPDDRGKPVGSIRLNESASAAVDTFFGLLPRTEFTNEARALVKDSWNERSTVGQAFGTLLARLLGKFGLVIVDPMDPALKRLAAPIYQAAVAKSREMVDGLVARSAELTDRGYHAQVLVEKDYFPLFYIGDDGLRRALRQDEKGVIRVKDAKTSFARDELSNLALDDPDRLSPGVMLRPLVQDFLFPTICYFGGGAEIAYFAQNSEVYRVLERPATPIFHRQSFTIVEARHARTLEKFELSFPMMLNGQASVLPAIVDRFIDPKTAAVFAEAEGRINAELDRLDQALSQIDVTLAANLATRRRKIVYHIGALRDKYRRRRAEIDESIGRRVSDAFTSLLPAGSLQERTLNVLSFVDRVGPGFIDSVYEAVDLDDKGHRIIYL